MEPSGIPFGPTDPETCSPNVGGFLNNAHIFFNTAQGALKICLVENEWTTIIGGGGGSVTWGSIGGTLASQTDVSAAIAAREAPLTFTSPLSRTGNTVTSTGGGGGGLALDSEGDLHLSSPDEHGLIFDTMDLALRTGDGQLEITGADEESAYKGLQISKLRLDNGQPVCFGPFDSTHAALTNDSVELGLAAVNGSNQVLVSIKASKLKINTTPLLAGAGSPEGSVAAPVGATYRRTDGGTGSTFYVKESGTGSTGWRAL